MQIPGERLRVPVRLRGMLTWDRKKRVSMLTMERTLMSRPPWQAMLVEMLRKSRLIARVAIVGVAHELHGDDTAGLVVAHGLQKALVEEEHLLVLQQAWHQKASLGRCAVSSQTLHC
jgi:hypothetical protein